MQHQGIVLNYIVMHTFHRFGTRFYR